MALLIHPAHRKFIKLLRSYADRDTIINITDQDKDRLSDLIRRTDNALERHKSAYKLILEILNRNTPSEEGFPFTHHIVDIIERTLAKCEFRQPYTTILGAVVIPFLQFLNKKLNKSWLGIQSFNK